MVHPLPRAGPRFGPRLMLSLLAIAACAGSVPLPGSPPVSESREGVQYQPLPTPRSMAPPAAPARPPNTGVRPFGQWQKEGDHFRMKPGFTGPADKAPIWVPGYWTTDADSNRVWVPGEWR